MNATDQRYAVVTGAAQGIGLATVEYFVNKGLHVGAFDLNRQALHSLKTRLGDQVEVYSADVTDAYSMQLAFEEFAEFAGGRIDVLVNNAGVLAVGEFGEVDLQAQRRIIDVNIFGVVNSTYAALPYLQRSAAGKVVNVGSASALYGHPLLTTYAASKSAVSNLTEGLHMSLKKQGIRVSEVQPLYVQTSMVDQNIAAWEGLKRSDIKLKPQDVAAAIWRAAHGKRRHVRVGTMTKLFGFLVRIMPNRLAQFIVQTFIRHQ